MRKRNFAKPSGVEPTAKKSAERVFCSDSSQAGRILAYLRKGHSITTREAADIFGCYRLSARIKDIEKKIGYPPLREKITVKNRDGKEVQVAKYYLPDESI